MSLRTEYEFVLPRGYLDENGVVHRRGTMRLATARDELEPLRDPTINGPDDPQLTILVLARTVQTLGDITLVTPHEIEGLFAADLAYLQDFYGVINFGTEADIAQLLEAQRELTAPKPAPAPAVTAPVVTPDVVDEDSIFASDGPGRRSAIEEVSTAGR